ncbi:hypothetical protein GCM10010208_14080 [Actinomadura livida]|nr:hypothetical protein GCM10010208_14080 [Actinomadura livida]
MVTDSDGKTEKALGQADWKKAVESAADDADGPDRPRAARAQARTAARTAGRRPGGGPNVTPLTCEDVERSGCRGAPGLLLTCARQDVL